jgi:hypothetical protein
MGHCNLLCYVWFVLMVIMEHEKFYSTKERMTFGVVKRRPTVSRPLISWDVGGMRPALPRYRVNPLYNQIMFSTRELFHHLL